MGSTQSTWGIDFRLKRNRSIFWQWIRADPCHRYGCPEYLRRTSPVARPALNCIEIYPGKSKKPKIKVCLARGQPQSSAPRTHEPVSPTPSSKKYPKIENFSFVF